MHESIVLRADHHLPKALLWIQRNGDDNMDWNERRTRFRKHMEGNTCLRPGSVFDPISARIAEDLGFEMGMFAGSVASLTVMGAPDLIVLTLK